MNCPHCWRYVPFWVSDLVSGRDSRGCPIQENRHYHCDHCGTGWSTDPDGRVYGEVRQ